MATPQLETPKLEDPYRSFLHGDSERETVWRYSSAPSYNVVNQVFESERTQKWKPGSLEEIVQNLVKTWEMEFTHKTRLQDFKTMDGHNFSFSVNGRRVLNATELAKIGTYNALLGSLHHQLYDASNETSASSHRIFRGVFPDGFAWEVLEVYSGPPTVVFKWRHWGRMNGSFKNRKPTGRVIEAIGTAVAKVTSELKIRQIEVYYDPGEFLAQLASESIESRACPFSQKLQAPSS